MADPSASDQTAAPGDPARSRMPLFLAAVLATVWIALLIALAVETANPLVLNREQILKADSVVQARIDDPAKGSVTVQKIWHGGELTGKLTVAGLDPKALKSGRSYLLPLSRHGRDWEITTFEIRPPGNGKPAERSPAYVYPATPEALEQLQRLLK